MPDAPVIPEDQGNISDDLFNGNSQQVSYSNAVTIHYTEDGMLNVDNPFENAGVEVLNNGQHVIINSTITDKELNYILQGATSNGSIKIYGEKKFALILNGVYIKNTSGAAINIQNKKKCELVLVDNTNNRLIDSSEYTYIDGEDMKGTLFTEGNIEIANTTGSLELRGLNKHAFCSDGALTINGGSLIIKEAVSDGIHTNDEITINGGVIDIR